MICFILSLVTFCIVLALFVISYYCMFLPLYMYSCSQVLFFRWLLQKKSRTYGDLKPKEMSLMLKVGIHNFFSRHFKVLNLLGDCGQGKLLPHFACVFFSVFLIVLFEKNYLGWPDGHWFWALHSLQMKQYSLTM